MADPIITCRNREKWVSICTPATQLHYYTIQNQTQETVPSISGWVLPHKPARTPTLSWQSLTESLLTGESGFLVHPSSTWTQTQHCKTITQSVSSASHFILQCKVQSNQILNKSNTLKCPILIPSNYKWKPRYVLSTYNKCHRINIHLQYWGSSPETHAGYSNVQVTLSCIPNSHC